MKLLNLTTRYLLILVLIVPVLWSIVFYYSIQNVVNFEMEEYLRSRTKELIEFLSENPELIQKSIKLHKTDFVIQSISAADYKKFSGLFPNGKFVDISRYVEAEGEEEPFRMMECVFHNGKQCYKITLEGSMMDARHTLHVIIFNMAGLSVVLAVFILLFNRQLLQNIWKPFYNTLEKIKQYNVDQHTNIQLKRTSISEFNELNDSFENLIERSRQSYTQQKQFIENASHEIQTPLTVVMSKLELFTQNENLNYNQAELIRSVRENLGRLSRLNRSLLLLSKIDNHQFETSESIDVVNLVERTLSDYEEMTEFKKLKCELRKEGEPTLFMNADLAYVMVSNLIRNAVFHNYAEGFIDIVIEAKQITFANSGEGNVVAPERMFERFKKGSESSFSQGLGLAIVASICSIYQFKIEYLVKEGRHVVVLGF